MTQEFSTPAWLVQHLHMPRRVQAVHVLLREPLLNCNVQKEISPYGLHMLPCAQWTGSGGLYTLRLSPCRMQLCLCCWTPQQAAELSTAPIGTIMHQQDLGGRDNSASRACQVLRASWHKYALAEAHWLGGCCCANQPAAHQVEAARCVRSEHSSWLPPFKAAADPRSCLVCRRERLASQLPTRCKLLAVQGSSTQWRLLRFQPAV